MRSVQTILVGISLLCSGGLARAEDPPAAAAPVATATAPAPEPEPAPPPTKPAPPYSLPWQLRPLLAVRVLRIEDSVAFYKDAMGNHGSTNAIMLLGGYRAWRQLTVVARLGMVANDPPTGKGAFSFVNPMLATYYSWKLPEGFRIAGFLGLTLPVGMGGGDKPDAAVAAATSSGILARSAMDNAMFAVNDMTIIPGIDIGYVGHDVTLQLEMTILQLNRVRGAAAQPDKFRTNMTMGAHLGLFIIPQLSFGAEVRYQRWLSTPTAVKKDTTGTLRDNVTLAFGLRTHWKAGKAMLRPGISYSRGVDKPMDARSYNIVQFDFPVIFP